MATSDALSPKAAIYIRVSTQMQIDKDSLRVQRSELIAYCTLVLQIQDYEVFEDPGYSAKNTDRPDYQRMIARIRSGEFSHLLVWKIDRISRNLMDFSNMYAELKTLGVTFVSKNEQFDTSTAIGEAMLKIILVFAELERNMTSERVTAVMVSRANNGQWNGGRIPYGYTYDKSTKEFEVNDAEAAVINLMFDLYESEGSLLQVCKRLNENGYRHRTGSLWNPSTLHKVLVNPFTSGGYRYNRHGANGNQSAVRDESEWITIENHHEPIIDKARQDRVIAMLSSKNRSNVSYKTYQRQNVHIFAGLLECGSCGSNMIATIDRPRANGWRPSIYSCRRRRRTFDCDNKYISDIVLGPFIFNYISNILKARNNIGRSTTLETFENKLLRGPEFESIAHIGRDGLEAMLTAFKTAKKRAEYIDPGLRSTENAEATSNREFLLSEKSRLERGLNRLSALYLYSESGMAEKDYIIQRKEMQDKLNAVDAELNELSSDEQSTIMSDAEFVESASYFIMTETLQNKKYVNFEKFYQSVNPKTLKNFVNFVIQKVCIKNGKITSITFKSGITHQFFYRPE